MADQLASGLWGAAAGIAMSDQDNASRQLQQIAIQQGQIKTQAEGLELKQAQTAWDAQQQVAAKMAAAMDKKGGGGSGGLDSVSQSIYGIADSLYQLAEAQFEAKLPNEAADTIEKASRLQFAQAQTQAIWSEQQEKTFTDLSTTLSRVTDGTTWANAKTTFMTAYPQEANTQQAQQVIKHLDAAFMQDSAQGTSNGPKAIQAILQSAAVQKQQLAQQTAAAKIKQDEASAKKDTADIRKLNADADAAEARANWLNKGGAGGGLPKAAEINAASDLIKGRKDLVGDDPDPVTVRNLARIVAIDAKDIAAEKGVDMNTATTEALDAAIERGDLNRVPQKATKASAASKASDTLKTSTVADIDSLIAEIQRDPTVVGARGALSRGLEVARTATGLGKQDTRAHEFQSRMQALLLKLPKALTGTSKSAKDERAKIDDIANGLKVGSTPEIALAKLRDARQSILGDSTQGRVTVVAPDGTTGTIPAEQLKDALAKGYKQQ
jgi:hypothetical protein